MMRHCIYVLVTVVVTLATVAGCADAGHYNHRRVPGSEAAQVGVASQEAVPASSDVFNTAADAPSSQTVARGDDERIERQIVYRATLELVVEDFTGVPQEVEQLAQQHDGFVSNSTLQGSTGTARSGQWTIRVPVKQYGTFLQAAKTLGEFASLTTESEEVTAEYYDVQARIRNQKKAEERLIELLEENSGKLEDLLNIEKHLVEVRETIEQLEGRMRVLKDLTALSTVTLTIREIHGYQPPESASFGDRITRAWHGSLTSLTNAGKNAVITLVAITPWLPIVAVVLLIVWLLVRRIRVSASSSSS